MAERQQAAARLVLEDPDVQAVSSFIGVDGSNATLSAGRMQIALKPQAERNGDLRTVMARLQESLGKQDGLTVYMQPVQDLTIEDRVSRTQYQMTLSNPDLKVLSEWTPKLVDRLRQVPGLKDVTDDLQDDGLQTWVEIDRDAAARLGITAEPPQSGGRPVHLPEGSEDAAWNNTNFPAGLLGVPDLFTCGHLTRHLRIADRRPP
ncbi:hypothetical protein G6F31_017046 [Rhizopus arrhizus]|nr:hypothetical protein G6F31_017046 [Rhizopus arrhizus]